MVVLCLISPVGIPSQEKFVKELGQQRSPSSSVCYQLVRDDVKLTDDVTS